MDRLRELYESSCHEIIKMTKTEKNLRDSIIELQTRQYYLEQDKNVLRIQLKEFTKQHQIWMERTCITLHMELLEKNQLIHELREILVKTGEIFAENQEMDEMIVQLKAKLLGSSKLKDELVRQEVMIDELRSKLDYSDQFMVDKDQFDQTSTLLKQKEEEIMKCMDELKAKNNLVEVLQGKLHKTENDLDACFLRLEHGDTGTAESLNTIANLQDEIEFLKQTIEEQAKHLDRQNSQLQSYHMDNYTTKQLGNNSEEMQRLVAQVLSLQKELEAARVELKNKQAAYLKLKDDLHSQELSLVEMKQHVAHTPLLKEELISMNQIEKELRERLTKCRCAELLADLRQKDLEIEHLYRELEASKHDKETFNKMVDELTMEMNVTTHHLEYLRQILSNDVEIEELEEKNVALTATMLGMEDHIDALQRQLALADANTVRETKINQLNCSRIEELQNMLGVKQLEINRLNDVLNALKNSLDQSQRVSKQLESTVIDLKQELAEKVHQQSMSEEMTDACIAEVSNCKRTLTSFQDKARQLKCIVNDKTDEMNRLVAEHQTQTNTIRVLKQTLQDAQNQHENELTSVQLIVNGLECKISDMEIKYQNLQDDYQQSDARLAFCRQTEAQSKEKEKNLITVISTLKKKLDECEDQYSEIKSQLETDLMEKTRCIEQLRVDYDQGLREAEIHRQNEINRYSCDLILKDKALQDAHKCLNETQSELEAVQAKYCDKEACVCALKTEIDDLHKEYQIEINKYKRQIVDNEKLLQDVRSLNEKNYKNFSIATQENSALRDQLTEQELQLKNLENQYDARLQDTVDQIDALKKQNFDYRGTIQNLKTTLEKTNKKMVASSVDIENLQVLLAEKDNSIYTIRVEHEKYIQQTQSECQCEIKNYQKQIAECTALTRDLKCTVERCKMKIDNMRQENLELQDQIKMKQDEMDTLVESYERQLGDNDNIHQNELRKCQLHISENTKIMREMKATNEKNNRTLNNFSNEIVLLKEQLSEKDARNIQMQNNYDRKISNMERECQTTTNKLQHMVSERENTINDLHINLERNSRNFTTTSQEVADLKEQIIEKDLRIREMKALQQDSIDQYENQCQCVVKQYQAQIAEYEEKIGELERGNEKLNQALILTTNEANNLNQLLGDKEKTITDLLDNHQKYLEDLENGCQCEIKAYTNKITDYEIVIKEMKKTIDKLNTELSYTIHQISELKQKIAEKDIKIESILRTNDALNHEMKTKFNTDLKRCQMQMHESEKIIQDLKLAAETNFRSITGATQEITKLRDELAEKEIVNLDLKTTLDNELRSNENKCQCEIRQLQMRLGESERKIRDMNTIHEKQRKQLCNLADEISMMIDQVAEKDLEIQRLKETCELKLNDYEGQSIVDLKKYHKQIFEKDNLLQEMRVRDEKNVKKLAVTLEEMAEIRDQLANNEITIQELNTVHENFVLKTKTEFQNEIRRYQKQIKDYEKIIQDLKITNDRFSKKIKIGIEEIDNMNEQLTNRELTIQEIQNAHENYAIDLENQCQRTLKQYKKEDRNKEKIICDLQTAMERANKNNTVLSAELSGLHEELDKKQLEFDDLQTTHNLYAAEKENFCQCEFNRLQNQITDRDKTIQQLKTSIENHFKKFTCNTSEVVKDLRQQLMEKDQIMEDLHNSHEQYVRELENRFRSESQTYQKKLAENGQSTQELKQWIDRNSKQLKTTTEEVADLRWQIQERDATIRELRTSNESLINEIENQCQCEIKKKQMQLNEKDRMIQEMKLTIGRSKKVIEGTTKDHSELYEQLKERDATIHDLKLNNEKSVLENKDFCESELNRFRKLVDERDKTIQEHIKKQMTAAQAISGLRNELEDKQMTLISLNSAKEEALIETENRYQNEINRYERLIRNCEANIQELNQSNERNSKQLNAAVKELNDLRTQISDKDVMMYELNMDHTCAIRELDNQHRCDTTRLEKQLVEKDHIIRELQMYSEKHLKQYASTSEEVQDLREQLVEKDRIVKDVQNRNETYLHDMENQCQCEMKKYQNEIRAHLRTIQELKCSITNKSDDFLKLRDNLTRTENEMQALKESCGTSVNEIEMQCQCEITNLKHVIAEKDGVIEDLKKTFERTRLNASTTCLNLRSLNEQLVERQHIIDELMDQRRNFEQQCQCELQKCQLDLQNCKEQLIEKVKVIRACEKGVGNYCAKFGSITEQVSQLRDALLKKDRDLSELKENNQNYILSVETRCQCKIKRYQTQLDEDERIIEDLNRQINSNRQESKELQTTYQHEVEKYQQKILTYEKRIHDYKIAAAAKGCDCSTPEVQELRQQILEKETEIQQLQTAHEFLIRQVQNDCKCELAKYQERTQECEHIIQELRLSVAAKNNHRLNYDELLEQLEQKEQYIQQMMVQHEELMAEINNQCQCEVKRYQNKVHEHVRAIQKLQASIAELMENHQWELKLMGDVQRESDALLETKDREMMNVKASAEKNLKLFTAANKKVDGLKLEIAKLFNVENELRYQNENLKGRLENFTHNMSSCEEQNKMAVMQLDKCLIEISRVHAVKKDVEDNNATLQTELQTMRTSMFAMQEENIRKSQSLYEMEKILAEITANRDELRAESRQVLHNIRIWLQEQRNINEDLSVKINAKCVQLKEMKLERVQLMKQINSLNSENNRLIERYEKCRPCPAPCTSKTNYFRPAASSSTNADSRPTSSTSGSFKHNLFGTIPAKSKIALCTNVGCPANDPNDRVTHSPPSRLRRTSGSNKEMHIPILTSSCTTDRPCSPGACTPKRKSEKSLTFKKDRGKTATNSPRTTSPRNSQKCKCPK